MPSSPGGIRVNPNGQTAVVTFTLPNGGTPVAYSSRSGAGTIALPATVSAETTFWFQEQTTLTVSALVGTQQSATSAGTTATVDLSGGGVAGLTVAVIVQSGGSSVASAVAVTPSGTVSSTNVQAALLELASDYAAADTVVVATATAAATGAAIQKAALGIGYGLVGGTPNPPYLVAPTIGANLWTTANMSSYSGNAGTGGVINTSTVTPSLTSDSTTKSIRTRFDLLSIYSRGSATGKYRLTFDVTTTAVTGSQPMNVKIAMLKGDGTVNFWYDTQRKLWSSGQPVMSAYQGNPVFTGHRFVVEIDSSLAVTTPTQYLEVAIDTNSSNSAGSVSLSNVSLYQIPAMSPVIRAGWTAAPANGAQFNVEIPMVDGNGTQRFLRYTFQQDGNLYLSPSGCTLYYDAALGGNSRFQMPASTTADATYRVAGFYINNSDSIFEVLKTDNTIEFRGNTHGGETGRTGTFTSDYQVYMDFGDGNGWQQLSLYDAWGYTGYRVKIVQQTKVQRSDQGSPFANIDRTFYIYPDGTMRKDQTVTFLQTQAMAAMIWEMASFSPNNYAANQYAAGFRGRIGVGQSVVKETDFNARLSIPTASAPATATTGGTISGNFLYGLLVTAVNNQGETTPNIQRTTINVPAGTNTNTVTANWAAVTGAVAYKVYFGLPGFERHIATVAAGTLTYTVTGSETIGSAPPVYNSAATQSTSDVVSVSNPDWAVYYDPVGQACFSFVIDHSAIQAGSMAGAQGITARLQRVDQSIVKNYWDLQFTGMGTGGSITVANGTVWTGTTYRVVYLPRDPNRFETEQTIRGGAVQQLATVYTT